ncbi:MAG: hypothetical protein AMXMBFR84_44190 [Candidatus Hydrogenedentota bacterium]
MKRLFAVVMVSGLTWAQQLPPSIRSTEIGGSSAARPNANAPSEQPAASNEPSEQEPIQSKPVENPEPAPAPEAAAPASEGSGYSAARDREEQRKREGKRVAAFWVTLPGR